MLVYFARWSSVLDTSEERALETEHIFRLASAEQVKQAALPSFDSTPWASGSPLRDTRVALVTTAGLHRRDDRPFGRDARDYRVIPADVDPADLLMTHISVNFDRTGFQQDVNVVFPLEHLRVMAAHGEIGSLADWHYSFMGGVDAGILKDAGTEVGRLLRADGVTAALLVPV